MKFLLQKDNLKSQKIIFELKNKYFSILLLSLSLILVLSPSLLAADIGGKASLISNLTYADSELDNSLAAELELEWYLPYDFPLDIQNRAVISLDEAAEDQAELWFKKLYLRQKLGPLTAKLGKQPVSWAYGALINPVDYSLGAENLEEESRAKYVNGLELYYPINWGSGLTFVVSDIEGKEHKWALRGRTTFRGYDLSASYVKTPEPDNADLERYGLTVKGDLGPAGIYGAYSRWQSPEINYDIYQVGTDYSYNFLAGSQLYLQAEYLRLEGAAGDISGFDLFNLGPAAEESSLDSINNLDFLNTNLSYEIDDFSSIGILTVTYLDDGSTIFIPKYSYLFSSNLLLELRGSIAAGSKDKVLGGAAKAVEINLSYTF